jgi:hypothetical protein
VNREVDIRARGVVADSLDDVMRGYDVEDSVERRYAQDFQSLRHDIRKETKKALEKMEEARKKATHDKNAERELTVARAHYRNLCLCGNFVRNDEFARVVLQECLDSAKNV